MSELPVSVTVPADGVSTPLFGNLVLALAAVAKASEPPIPTAMTAVRPTMRRARRVDPVKGPPLEFVAVVRGRKTEMLRSVRSSGQ
jgi:hypothetical protein